MRHNHRLASARRTGAVSAVVFTAALLLPGCAERDSRTVQSATNVRVTGVEYVVHDSLVAGTVDVSGVVEPIQQASLSSKLMATVVRVNVREGDRVQSGDILLQLDARDLVARADQVAASVSEAEATQRDAAAQAKRIRALYDDSAATRVQLEAVELAVIRAGVTLRAANAAAAELAATRSYATIRAPFRGVVTQRLADEGTFATPGAPLIVLQDVSAVRVVASAPAENVRLLRKGSELNASVDNRLVRVRVEGVLPSGVGDLFVINATAQNASGDVRVGSAAVLHLATTPHAVLLVPAAAIRYEGDLTGVVVRGAERDETRWIRVGATIGALVEVTAGLQSGDVVVVAGANKNAGAAAGRP
ncbi:MAG: efflux RND transporter periplasmic adaptor subunit [Gemmatimonadaceae bacterium]